MDWVLNHLQLIIAAAGAVAWWLNQRRLAKTGADEAPPKEQAFEDPDLAERTRRIREEIQRKIEQRTKGPAQPSSTTTQRETTLAPPIIREVVRPPALPKSKTAHLEAERTAEILEQQAALAERLRQAKEMKAAALRRVQFENQVSNEESVAAVSRGVLNDDLRNPDALRRAFVLREIIGPPVALR